VIFVVRLPQILLRPLMGAKIKVLYSRDPTLTNLEGEIVFETRNTFDVLTKKGIKTIIKKICIFEIQIKNHKIIVDGKYLENRLRRLHKLGKKRR